MNEGGSPRARRGRPRSTDAEQRICEGAIEEYVDRGWSGFTMDAVARRAGVGKSTVYLRWRDKDRLLIDAVAAHAEDLEDFDTGSLRGDLEHLATTLFRSYTEAAGWATLRLSIDVLALPESMRLYQERVNRRRQHLSGEVARRALERGEIDSSWDTTAMFRCLYGAVVIEVLGLDPGWHADEEEIRGRASRVVSFLLAGRVPD